MLEIRPAGEGDIPALAAIQTASPEAAQWRVEEYLAHRLTVAAQDGTLAGFLATRLVAPDECEILTLAVHPDFRRKGVATGLIRYLLQGFRGSIYLEVRASNSGAQEFYKCLGFQQVSYREDYYDAPRESGVVMKYHSC